MKTLGVIYDIKKENIAEDTWKIIEKYAKVIDESECIADTLYAYKKLYEFKNGLLAINTIFSKSAERNKSFFLAQFLCSEEVEKVSEEKIEGGLHMITRRRIGMKVELEPLIEELFKYWKGENNLEVRYCEK